MPSKKRSNNKVSAGKKTICFENIHPFLQELEVAIQNYKTGRKSKTRLYDIKVIAINVSNLDEDGLFIYTNYGLLEKSYGSYVPLTQLVKSDSHPWMLNN